MTDLRQAAEMALEELEMQVESQSGAYLAINALRQALAEKQEPKREWVGLTDVEISKAVGNQLNEVYLIYFRKVIAKLKEKNT